MTYCDGKNTIGTNQIKICCDSRKTECKNSIDVKISDELQLSLCFLTFDKIALTHLSKENYNVVRKS